MAHVEHSGSLPSQHQLEMMLATPKSVGLPLSQIWKGGERAVSSWKGGGTIVAYVEPSLPSQYQLEMMLVTPKSVGLPLSQIWKGGERAASSCNLAASGHGG